MVRTILLLIALLCSPGILRAQTYPTRPVTIVIPGAPGSIADLVGRRLAEQFQSDWGQPVVVDNRTGAGGTIAYEYLARRSPDGYTLGIALGGFSIANVMFRNARFDVLTSFTPITQLVISPMVFVTGPNSPYSSLADVVEAAKGRPGALRYASFGIGSSSHLAAEMFRRTAGIEIEHIPYRTGAAAAPDLISGQLDFAVLDAVTALSLGTSGTVRVLATSGTTRMSALPEVPTATEAGIPFTSIGWLGLFAPANLPEGILDRVAAAANKAISQPAMLALMAQSGSQVPDPPLTPQQWTERFRDYVEVFGQLARDAGMSAD